MKKFFREFKEFISRGSVLDMAVGIIIGGAFTAIITAVVGNILTPLINWIPGGGGDTGALQVVLREAVKDADGAVITEALVIDFGAVISAVVTFLITAFVLFLVIKTINTMRAGGQKLKKKLKKGEPAPEPAPEPEPEPAPAETSDDLLRQIRDLLAAQQSGAEHGDPTDSE